jgi:DNA-binding NarL/FixJ family response regulator
MNMGIVTNGTRNAFDVVTAPQLPDDIPAKKGGVSGEENIERKLLIVDSRALDRECFAQSLVSHGIGMIVLPFGSVESFKATKQPISSLSAVLFNVGGRRINEPAVADEIKKLVTELGKIPLIILADTDELPQIMQALELGARGFIPTSVGIDVCIEAIGLSMAGGVFVPASSVLAMRKLVETNIENHPYASMFTSRQAEVVEALRRGKANKIIAYELNLRESTVKVHIRNIMRKLKATNRTEVAYKINDMFPNYSLSSGNQASRSLGN